MARTPQTVIEYRSYELSADRPVWVLTGENWRISPVRSERLHFHNCLEFGMVHEGSGTMVFPSGTQAFHAHDLTFVDRNTPHSTYSDPGTHSLWSYLFFDPALLFGGSWVPPAQHFPPHLLLPEGSADALSEIFRGILREHSEQKPGSDMAIQSLCMLLTIELMRLPDDRPVSEQPRSSNADLAPALDYLRDHYSSDFPIELLAELCHLSPTHFRRLFRQQTGTTPVAFLNQKRILQSCALLRTSGLSIAEIAGQVGFTTLSSFNRHFAEMMQCSPRQWRKQEGITAPVRIMPYTGWTEADK